MKKDLNLISVQSIAILFFALSFGSLNGQTKSVNPKSDYLMCSGTNSTTDISGTFYDSGGETGNYSDGENCTFLINPGCAFSITMSFNSFQTEGCCDYFTVYDGIDNTGELLLITSGYTIPDPVIANSGAMFITFTSDGSIVNSGWEAVWTSVVPTTPPIADFSVSTTTPLFNSEVQFTDLTTNMPNGWDWDFGDGQSSNLQNPVHSFQQAGLHTITLISDNCFSTDTVSHELTVSEPPVILISPGSIIETIDDCNDSISTPLTISNNGDGPLEFNLMASNATKNTVELLALTYGVDYYEEYLNTLNAINQHFTDYNLTEINTTSPTVLANELGGKQVLLVAEQENGSSSVWLGFSPILQEFVNNGGVVIFCGTMDYYCITNSGLFDIIAITDAYSILTVVDNTHPITEGLPLTFQSVEATYAAYINNEDATMLVEYSSPYQVVSYREIGSGVAIYIAFDYYNFDYNSSKIIANAVEFGGNISSYGNWFSFSPEAGVVEPGDSIIVDVSFNAQGLVNDIYEKNLIVESNASPQITIPCSFTLLGAPEISLSENCLNFGDVMAFTTVTDSVNIINSGCAPLIISEISNVFAEFEINIESTEIDPFSSEMIVVSFSPTTFEPFSDTITILNNDSTVNICLSGTGFEGPVISSNPTSLEYSLQACGDNTTDILTINNSGGTDLNFEITFSNAKSSLEMLALTYGVDYNNEYQNTLNAINEYYTDYNLTEINTTNPTELQNALANKNLLLIAEQEYGEPYVFADFNPILQSFVNEGGVVIICGTNNYGCTTASGLFYIDYAWNSYYSLTVVDNTHPITMGLPEYFSPSDYTYASYINNSDRTVLVRDSESYYDVVCYREIGLGYAIFIAFDYSTYSDEAARIIGQAAEFSNTNVDPDWLIFNELAGTVTPGESNDLIISVNSEGLEGGVHETVININSNDPQTPVLMVPASLEVDYNLCCGFSYEIYGCSGHVEFYDETINTPTSWLWNFGDGETSTSINPTHTYTSTGSFQVSLSVTNSYGTDIDVQNIVITENFGPISANCYPEPSYGYYYSGISNVSFANINNSSEGSNAGFEDFTCIGFADVTQGVSYNMSVTTLSEENVRVWIDFDNSGSFETEEMMMNSGSGYSHSFEFEIPQECVFNVGLRMRVGSDYYYNLPEPCVNPEYGQHEDYTIIIQSNTLPPVASINHDIIDECNGIVQFTDGSGNMPTSWLWEFGDGGTSADQNPLHIYTTAGMYTVTLIASNSFGTDTATSGILVNSLYPEMEITGNFLEDEPMYFSNNTPGAISWLWNFGDGYASSLQNPEHIYSESGIYQVTLMVTNGILCQKSIFETIEIDEVNGINRLSNGELMVYPNPSNGKFIIQSSHSSGEIYVTVMSISGKMVYQGKICGNEKAIKEDLNLQFLDQGIYLLKLYNDKNSTVHKLIIE